jgi:hypothetical protein
MSYHRSMGEVPAQPTDVIEHNRVSNTISARVRRNEPVTREQVLYMFDTMPIVGCFGGPVLEFPSDVKSAVERMAPGAIVPTESVRRVYKRWSPGGVR